MTSQASALTEHQKKMLKASLDWKFSDDFPRFVLYDKEGNLFEPVSGQTPVSYVYTELTDAFLKNPEAELGVLLGGAPWQTLCVLPEGEARLKSLVPPDFFSSVFYYKKCTKNEYETSATYYFIENVNSNFFQSLELFPGCRIMGFNETLPFAFSLFENFYIATEKNRRVMPFPPRLLELKNALEEQNLKSLFALDAQTGIDAVEMPSKVLFETETEKDVLDLAELFFGDADKEKAPVAEEKKEQIPNPLYVPLPSEEMKKTEKCLDISQNFFDESKPSSDVFQDMKSLLADFSKEAGEKGEVLPEPELSAALLEKVVRKPSLPPMVYSENTPSNFNAMAIIEQNIWEKLFLFTLLNGISFQKFMDEKLEVIVTSAEIERHTGAKIESLYSDMQRFGEQYPNTAQKMINCLSASNNVAADKKLSEILSACRSSLLAGINTPQRPAIIRTAERKSIRLS